MIEYRILPKEGLILVVPSGVTTGEEIARMSDRLRSDPEFSADYDALVDNTFLEHPPTGAELRELADPRGHVVAPGTRLAVVAPANVTYGTSRMHQTLAESRYPLQIEVFRNRSSALEWLGREEDGVDKILEEMGQGQQRLTK